MDSPAALDGTAGQAVSAVGRWVFSEVRRGAWWTVPFLRLGAYRNILFPDQGENVPFTIENYPYVDGFGRPSVTFVRTLELPRSKQRRFDATMVYSPDTGGIIDYLGTHQHLATDLVLEVLPDGSLHLQSTGQRFYEGFIGFTFPAAFTGTGTCMRALTTPAGFSPFRCRCGIPLSGSCSATGASSPARSLSQELKEPHADSSQSVKKAGNSGRPIRTELRIAAP
jgi:hypothetical protein